MLEGPHLVLEALRAGSPLDQVLVEAGATGEARLAADTAAEAGIAVVELPAGSLTGVLDAAHPQAVAALAPFLDVPVEDIADRAVATDGFVLVLAGVADPGNAGTLLRSAEAAGAAGAVLSAEAVDLYNPKTVRASAGAVFHLPVACGGPVDAVLDELGAAGVAIVGTAVAGATPLDEAPLEGPVALVVGNEAHGVPAAAAGRLDTAVTIPMVGRAESLNVAMAGTLLCFEAARRRRSMS